MKKLQWYVSKVQMWFAICIGLPTPEKSWSKVSSSYIFLSRAVEYIWWLLRVNEIFNSFSNILWWNNSVQILRGREILAKQSNKRYQLEKDWRIAITEKNFDTLIIKWVSLAMLINFRYTASEKKVFDTLWLKTNQTKNPKPTNTHQFWYHAILKERGVGSHALIQKQAELFV